MDTMLQDAPVGETWGWAGSARQFLSTTDDVVLDGLDSHHRRLIGGPAAQTQWDAWRHEVAAVRAGVRACVEAEPEVADRWSVAFEYELPLEGGRRPDVVVLAAGAVVVLEFKSAAVPLQSDVDQVRAYARDLADYHGATHGRLVVPVLVMAGSAPGFAAVVDGVTITAPEGIASYLVEAATTAASDERIDLDAWLDAPYEPLPSLVEAARRIFRHEPLPHVRHALSAGIPETVELLGRLVEQAAAEGLRVLAFVTGVPGSGKTLVGLRLVYERSSDIGGATFLSGNGPLVQVLQDALGSRVFVRDLHGFVRTYAMGRTARVPGEHVIVFDEAQRAWDERYMAHKRQVQASEPKLLIGIGERIPAWAALVGLVGEGQEIHSGEEGGMDQWREAVADAASRRPWSVHCGPRLLAELTGVDAEPHDELDLTVSLRSRRADQLHDWVRHVLEGSIPLAARLAMRVQGQDFWMYVTRDLEAAKDYVRDLYEGAPEKTFGLVASSHARSLPRFGVDNSYMATSRMNIARWFNGRRGDPLAATALERPVTEFGCQGLELDTPIVCWGEDLRWEAGGWRLTPIRRRYPQDDPERLLRNTYRVLLTRGRDGLVVWVPPSAALDETEHILLAAGLRPLPTVVEAVATGAAG